MHPRITRGPSKGKWRPEATGCVSVLGSYILPPPKLDQVHFGGGPHPQMGTQSYAPLPLRDMTWNKQQQTSLDTSRLFIPSVTDAAGACPRPAGQGKEGGCGGPT